ncbi:indoleamine 2,3-dioxygenase 1 isoform X2 [Clupea harengus]|uniref:Indoleamine 2,3-dioxygenase 1 isoform X2 n=1 Tax=Clupea harengus TaxID=7950 RepID=A0A6P3VZY9_CLUHA|nr:indoleamine 2,3-dioxygenase 1 isoform X2 [Clupea harengus]
MDLSESVDAENSDLLQPLRLQWYYVSEEYGFVLPEPLEDLPPYYQPWMEIAKNVTELIDSHSLRACVQKMPLLETHLLQGHRELRLAHLTLSVMTMGYVWQEGENDTVKVLPRTLAVPYWAVSQKLGLPPILTHADAVLANWKKKDPQGVFSMENLELLFTLPGGKSVHGFFMVTLLVELAAVPGIRAIPEVINGVNQGDVTMVTRALESISLAIDCMREALKLMHVYVEPAVFYGIMRIYLSGWKDNASMEDGLVYEDVQVEPMEFSGGSAAQSSLLHCFDELLGVKHEASSGAFLTRMRSHYMPPAHAHFIQDISLSRPSLRDFVLDRASEPLTSAYEHCVAKLVALRNYHINMVSRFITVPASRAKELRLRGEGSGEERSTIAQAPTALEERGTGGSGIMSFLKTVRDRTRGVSVSPSTHPLGAEVAQSNAMAGPAQKATTEASLLSKVTSKLFL